MLFSIIGILTEYSLNILLLYYSLLIYIVSNQRDRAEMRTFNALPFSKFRKLFYKSYPRKCCVF